MAMIRRRQLRKISAWLFKLLVTIGILYYLLQNIPVQQIFTSLANVNVIYLFPAFFLQIGMHYLNAMQLKIFSERQKMEFTVLGLIKINLITQFYGLLLPGELSAGLVKWHKLSRKNKMPAQAMACVVLMRTVFMLSLAILGIVFFLIEMPYHSTPILLSLTLGLACSVLLYLSIISITVSNVIENLLNGLKFLEIPEFIREKARNFWGSIKRFHGMSLATSNYTLFLSFVYHLAGIFSVYFIMQAVKINIPIISIIWIRSAVIFLQLFPISISGLGVREGAFVFLLGRYHVPSSDAMALSVIIFGITVFMALVGGAFEAHELLFEKKVIKNDLQ